LFFTKIFYISLVLFVDVVLSYKTMSLYKEAAQFLDTEQHGSLRTILHSTYERAKLKKSSDLKCDPKQVFALVSSTLKYKSLLTDVIKASGMLKNEKSAFMQTKDSKIPSVCLLMVHDLLVSKSGRINSSKSTQKDAVLRHKTRLKAELAKYKIKHKIKSISEIGENDQSE
jgi:putative methyltransferase